jgi:hypothetical protein
MFLLDFFKMLWYSFKHPPPDISEYFKGGIGSTIPDLRPDLHSMGSGVEPEEQEYDCPSDEIIERFQEQIDQIIESGKDDGTLFYLTEEKHSSPSWPAIKTVYLSKLHLVKLRFIKYSLLDRLDMLSSLKRVITTSTLPVFEDLEEKINKKTRVM